MKTELILLGDVATETMGNGVTSIDSGQSCLNPGGNHTIHCPGQ